MTIDFDKMNGLVPAIIQDAVTKNVLMLGFMNQEAYQKTIETKKVTFWSRTRQCLWTKGETSGHYLHLVSIQVDCDNDTLLVKVHPEGPTCHKGTDTCWGEENRLNPILFLSELQDFICQRHEEMPENSYTTSLFRKGVNKMAQKVGEEAVETVIEATNGRRRTLSTKAPTCFTISSYCSPAKDSALRTLLRNWPSVTIRNGTRNAVSLKVKNKLLC